MRNRPKSQIKGWLAMMCWAVAMASFAEPDFPPPPDHPIPEIRATNNQVSFYTSLTSSNIWENWHRRWSSNVVGAANYLDNFFGDPRLEEENNHTRIKLSIGIRFKEYEDVKVIRKISARLSLPKTSNRLQLVYDDLVESSDPDQPRAVIDDIADSTPDAALRLNLRAKRRSRVNADAGVRFGSPNQIFLRLRGSRNYELSRKNELRLIQSVRWYSAEGWISLSEVQFNRRMGWDWLLRSSSELEWAEEENGVRPIQTFSVFKTFSRRRALRISIGGDWPETPHSRDATYFFSVTHRRRVHSNWLFMQVQPGVEFPQERDYDPVLFFSLQFDITFGKPE